MFEKEQLKEGSSVGKLIGVVSGKGGVGKSLVTSLLAIAMNRAGKRTAILDADITGPSVPTAFGLKDRAEAGLGGGLLPSVSRDGIKVMSLNLLLDNPGDPVVWRGPLIAGTVKQFWTEVEWGDVEYMFVDMPPGTGDVALTVYQSLPLSGIVIVTSPQELVGMIVNKAVKMAEIMQIPVLGIVENMAWFECPECHTRHYLFGKSHVMEAAEEHHIPIVSYLPMDPQLAAMVDEGRLEDAQANPLDDMAKALM